MVFESHSHWAVGHVDGFSVRVFHGNGEITEAFTTYHELAERMADYPILDESDYSERELDATLSNIKEAAWRLKNEFDAYSLRSPMSSGTAAATSANPRGG